MSGIDFLKYTGLWRCEKTDISKKLLSLFPRSFEIRLFSFVRFCLLQIVPIFGNLIINFPFEEWILYCVLLFDSFLVDFAFS